MNNLLEVLQDHYAAQGHILLNMSDCVYRAFRYRQFHTQWDAVLLVEAVLLDEIAGSLADLQTDYPTDRPVLATWADGITKGDEAAIQAAGITVLTFEKEAVSHAMQEMS